jgi:uncharacterized protein (TIGR04206 family)
MSGRRRLVAIVAAGVLPWIVVLGEGPGAGASLVFFFGLVNPAPLHVTTLPAYLLVLTSGLPESLLAWPVASALWLGALSSGLSGVAGGREDRRLTGGLLVLAGLRLLPVTLAVGRPAGVTALPVGTAVTSAVGWWAYRDALAGILTGGSARER